MVRADARRLPTVVPDTMAVRDESVVELPREARSDDLAHSPMLSDVQNAGAGGILCARPEPAVVGSFDVGEETLAER